MANLRQIEAEMAKFESEIGHGNQMNPSLQFIPPHLMQGGPRFPPGPPPPPPPMMGMMRPPFMPPNMMRPPFCPPRFHQPRQFVPRQAAPPQQTGPVIEGAPKKYMPPGAAAAAMSGHMTPKERKINDVITATGGAGPVLPGPSTSFGADNRFQAMMMNDMAAIEAKRLSDQQLANTSAAYKKNKTKRFVRTAGHQVWEDPSLAEWDRNDFRLFCGDLGNEVSDELLAKAFRRYASFTKAKVIRDKRTNKSKGYGFVSFRESTDFIRAMKEMNGKYIGNRPIKLKRSDWQERQLDVVKKKVKEKKKLGLKL